MNWKVKGGEVYSIFCDMAEQPHLLVAGATGSGKSVVVNGIITTLLTKYSPERVQFILIDPKRVELSPYKNIPHTICYASEQKDMLEALKLAMRICDDRFKQMQVRGERKYSGGDVYVIIDEWADLMTTQRRDVAPIVQRLAQIGRASRVHVILCTQTPIAKIIPTEIKCNFDARVGLRTRNAQDSRNILGHAGLEFLPAFGQGVYMKPQGETHYIIPYVTEDKQNEMIDWWRSQCSSNLSKTRRFVTNILGSMSLKALLS